MSSRCAHPGCGFFGSAQTEGFCSQHYKQHLKIKQNQQAGDLVKTVPALVIGASSLKDVREKTDVNTVSALVGALSLKDDQEVVKTATPSSSSSSSSATTAYVNKSNRCKSCNKKTGLLGFACRCGGNYCGMHRYPEKHCCPFDFKTIGKKAIEEQNPLVKASKLADKI